MTGHATACQTESTPVGQKCCIIGVKYDYLSRYGWLEHPNLAFKRDFGFLFQVLGLVQLAPEIAFLRYRVWCDLHAKPCKLHLTLYRKNCPKSSLLCSSLGQIHHNFWPQKKSAKRLFRCKSHQTLHLKKNNQTQVVVNPKALKRITKLPFARKICCRGAFSQPHPEKKTRFPSPTRHFRSFELSQFGGW